MIVEFMQMANDVLDAVLVKKRAERLESKFGGAVCVVDVGTVAMPKLLWERLDQMGVWAALEEAKEAHAQLKKLGMA